MTTSKGMAENTEKITPLLVHMWGQGAWLAQMEIRFNPF